jgi:hypothetical protein
MRHDAAALKRKAAAKSCAFIQVWGRNNHTADFDLNAHSMTQHCNQHMLTPSLKM